jgi:hypothetical protein
MLNIRLQMSSQGACLRSPGRSWCLSAPGGSDGSSASDRCRVNFTLLPENDVRDKISREFSGEAGQYDVAAPRNFEIPIYARSRWIAPLDSYLAADPVFDQQDVLQPMTQSLSGDDVTLVAICRP